MTIKIPHRYTGAVIFTIHAEAVNQAKHKQHVI